MQNVCSLCLPEMALGLPILVEQQADENALDLKCDGAQESNACHCVDGLTLLPNSMFLTKVVFLYGLRENIGMKNPLSMDSEL